MILSIDESIQRLKAEIIAQDWRLNHKRVELLGAAFACLKERFKTRKGIYAILVMADNVLNYIRKRGDNSPPDSIDFLKEAMAHVVNLYEDPAFDIERDDKIFKKVYQRFNALKEKIKSQKQTEPQTHGEIHDNPSTAEQLQTCLAETHAPPSANDVSIAIQKASDQLRHTSFRSGAGMDSIEPQVVENLVKELKSSLQKAEGVGATLRQLLDEFLKGQKIADVHFSQHASPAASPPQQEPQTNRNETVERINTLPPPIEECPPAELLGLTIEETTIYLPVTAVACHRQIPAKKVAGYLKNSYVPIKDFSGFLQPLAKQFSGGLAEIKDSKLKKLHLPVMVPLGAGLPDVPDDKGKYLVVVSEGHWNGVILCSNITAGTKIMEKLQRTKNGDIAGIGYTAEDEKLPVIDTGSLLRREGFLVMV